jgi:hypothetical protein
LAAFNSVGGLTAVGEVEITEEAGSIRGFQFLNFFLVFEVCTKKGTIREYSQKSLLNFGKDIKK